ncbi:potassium channel family protein [Pseudoalteromonas sp. SM9913]|uniref:potassium channel family protein n=1 Tax=Pseudoalteromonas sp. (strain SM9913) TaxID=234831 RepID=UPI0001EF88F0|nr:potassium channel family protein [Pseudoalteromonas sp. SM9913]ADT67622.1 hypothetical protein PSM_A0672 [Pseudoalteromonas sp. SM9913]
MKILMVLSPTFAAARLLKKRYDRTKVIRALNSIYLWVAIVSSISLIIYQEYTKPIGDIVLNSDLSYIVIFLWSYFLISRCNEIFWAFLKDAFDKMDKGDNSESDLTPSERIKLSLKSYLELIVNFAMLYLLLPQTEYVWKDGNAPSNVAEALYFSGVTITTLGYGDISPSHWWPQFLTVYEVFCGFILLIVCFAIYAGRLSKQP